MRFPPGLARLRTRPSRTGALASRLGALGYAVPGTVVAVAVYTPLAWIDRRLAELQKDYGAYGKRLQRHFNPNQR